MQEKMLTLNFSEDEMKCKCGRQDCDASEMNMDFMRKLEELRQLMGIPLVVISGSRCEVHNKDVGGLPDSQHLFGNAADFNFKNQNLKQHFIDMAEKVGFKGIGVGSRLVHIDNRLKLARWKYKF